MRSHSLVLLAALCCIAALPAHAATTPPSIDRLYQQSKDERDRAIASRNDAAAWHALAQHDAARRTQARTLLDAGQIRTGRQLFEAAYLFGHGDAASDFLLSHVLADAALVKGYADARWWSAASLDRYLQSIKQPQVFGTQYLPPDSQGAYDRTLLPDALRTPFCVPTVAQQQQNLDAWAKKANWPYHDGCSKQ